jgi:predicted amidohydrolase YtcJ
MPRTRLIQYLAAAVVLSLPLGARFAAQAPTPPADLILRNGHIVTLDPRTPVVEALASKNGRLVAVGSNADMQKFVGPQTQVIDLAGQLATPGFIEGHGHFTGIGESKLGLELMGTKSWDEIVQMVADAAKKAKPGQWIVGRGWHQEKWTSPPQPNVEGFPLHASLDKVSPNNPVVLTHASGHGAYVNAKAMQLSGITRDTPNPSGGEILKDKSGDPVGFLRERAAGLVKRGAGEPTPTAAEAEARDREILTLADKEVIAKGITSFQDAGSSPATIDRMKRMIDAHQLNTRLWVMIGARDTPNLGAILDQYRTLSYGDEHLTVRAIKAYMDGALGSRGAWLLEPYKDKPDSTGLPSSSLQSIGIIAKLAIDHTFQLCIHAIGDRANREVLDIYEETFKNAKADGTALRWRIEHAQHINSKDIPRFGQLGVIASMQPIHATSDAPYVLARLGSDRAEEGAYVWQKLMKSGAVVTAGTDAPVEDVDPIPNYYAAVTRKTADGNVFYGDQKMSRMEALRAYTLQNAFAAFQERVKGSLTVGKLADVTVFTKDITSVPDEEIKTAKVSYTIIGGKIVYKKP